MGFYELKEQQEPPLPLAYKHVPLKSKDMLGDERSPCSRFIKLCCCSIWCSMILLLILPCAILPNADAKAKTLMITQGSNITGVEVAVNQVSLLPGIGLSQAEVRGIQVNNPEGYSSTPFFMKVDLVRPEVGMIRLLQSKFKFVEIKELTIKGLTVYLEQRVGLNKTASLNTRSNGKDLLAHCSRWAETAVTDTTRQYIVKNMNIEDMRVHIYMNSMLVKNINVPPMVVHDIGVKQGGVHFEELFDLIVQSLSVVGLQGEVWSQSNHHIV